MTRGDKIFFGIIFIVLALTLKLNAIESEDRKDARAYCSIKYKKAPFRIKECIENMMKKDK